ncbi:MAG: NAD(P)H-hydrate dehydratase [Gammaproteobacteria bacterium]|nr:NAD(P)H-hydrate dehydratase [Gammaproteobacteria bacterium]
MIQLDHIYADDQRKCSQDFLYQACRWLRSFSQLHRCVIGYDPTSEIGQYLKAQLPEIRLYQADKNVPMDWFIDAYWDQSHNHDFKQIHVPVLSIFLPSTDVDGNIKCDQILLDGAYSPSVFNHSFFGAQTMVIHPVKTAGVFIELESFRPSGRHCAHKYDKGAVALFGGSPLFASALVMGAKAAMISGAGYVLAVSEAPVPADESGIIWANIFQPEVRYYFDRASVFVWGLGMLPNSPLMAWAGQLKGTHVIDAGALEFVCEFNGEKIILMHAGEMARFLGVSSKHIQQHRVVSALKVARQTGAVVLLKGDYPVLVQGEAFYVVNADFSVFSRAGTGDILAGLVGSFCAQGHRSLDAVLKALQVGLALSRLNRPVLWGDYEAVFTES